jgi:hypothetical protein
MKGSSDWESRGIGWMCSAVFEEASGQWMIGKRKLKVLRPKMGEVLFEVVVMTSFLRK